MTTLLLELFSEEIPSRMQRAAAEQLQKLVLAGLEKHLLAPAGCKTFVSPRHLAIEVRGLPSVQPDVREERRGPKIGAPEQALNGFLQSTGMSREACEQRDGYYYATIERKGRAVAEVLKEICEAALVAFAWPKSMRWGARPLQWVRPLHRIVCMLDETVVPVQFAHLTASNITEGHRFLSPAPITLAHAEKYEGTLSVAHVLVDFEARRAKIKTEIEALAAKNTLRVIDDEALLNEVTGLVEWPVPLLCRFDAKFLDLPREVLISEMKNHQRYFALTDAAGALSTQFITVANMVNADGGKHVIAGNERVVRARLSDGEFYWDQDRKKPLHGWANGLKDVVFHAKVGMMDAKVARIEKLAVDIWEMLSNSPHPDFLRFSEVENLGNPPSPVNGRGDPLAPPSFNVKLGSEAGSLSRERERVARLNERSEFSRSWVRGEGIFPSLDDVRQAARLCKADLTSGMVGEFPELQGIMGRYYATAQGESPEIADAIRDHYKPVGAGDSLPESPLAAIIAIADKLDSIVSLFAAGEKPTGSKDPLALRRAALGILRILDHYQWPLDLEKIVDAEVRAFFLDRLKNMLREEDIRPDISDASLASAAHFVPATLFAQTRALQIWLGTAGGAAALAAIKRTLNILAAEEKKSKTTFAAQLSPSLALPAEKQLIDIINGLDSRLRGNDKFEVLSSLTAPINAFFDAVLVTEEGHREARLGLLAAVRDAASKIADFSKIEG